LGGWNASRFLTFPVGTLLIQPALFSPSIVAREEIMPRAIKRQQTAENIIVIVLTAVICLILIIAAVELPLKLVH
jgi:hypothetical protein